MAPLPLLLTAPDGRAVRAWDTGPRSGPVVFWHGGTPNSGEPPTVPLGGDAESFRWIGADRPGYGGSDPLPGRAAADVAADVALVADHLGIDRFAVAAHSGGGPHALAAAAMLPDRVTAVLAVASPAPGTADLDRVAGAAPSMAVMQRAAAEGRLAVERALAEEEDDPDAFTPDDHAALGGAWGWFLHVVQDAVAHGQEGQVEDELAIHGDWGVDLADVRAPVRLLHGDADRIVPLAHSRWLLRHLPDARLTIVPGAGHLSVLERLPALLPHLTAR